MAQSSVRIGDIENVSGEVTIAGGDIYKGFTAEQVSALLIQVASTFQVKKFDGHCPFKGLDVFEEEDADIFFGREKLVDELIGRVKNSRTVFITGPSGSGKSSLVRAGVIPALKQGAIEKSKGWLYETIKPGRDPLEALASAFSRLKSPELGKYFREYTNRPNTLQECAESALSGQKDQRLVLFIDQFEEVFTQVGKDKAEPFINLLTQTVAVENGRVIILFAMRSDFVSNCATYPELNDLLNRQFIQIGAMQPDELVSAIAQPGLRVGLRIDPDLVAQIINDMRGEPGTLPLMQFALKDLFDSQEAKSSMLALTLEDYLERGGIHKALERHADDVFSKLSTSEQELARTIFSGLIEIGRGTQDTRRTALFVELIPANRNAEDVNATVKKLADARLITTDEQAGKDTITISHEKLIEAWPWLKKLVNENRDVIALQNEIATDAKEWEVQKRDSSYLYTGVRLANVCEQMEAKKLVLGGLAHEFIQKGNSRQRRRQLVLASGVSAIFILLAFAVIVFNNQANANADLAQTNEKIANTAQSANTLVVEQRNEAISAHATSQANLNIARSGELASQALLHLEDNPELSLLLSVEAFEITDSYQTRNALLSALTIFPNVHRYFEPFAYYLHSVAFSEDGSLIAEMSDDKIIVFDRDSGEVIHQLGFGPFVYSSIRNITFSGDGTKIAASGETPTMGKNESIIVWDLNNDKVINLIYNTLPMSYPDRTIPPALRWQNIALNQDGTKIAIPSCAQFDEVQNICLLGQVEIRDTKTWTLLKGPWRVHQSPSFYLDFMSGEDNLFFVGCKKIPDCDEVEAVFLDTTTGGQIVKTLPAMPLPNGILPDGTISYYENIDRKSIFNVFVDRTLILWDTTSEEEKGRYTISKGYDFAGITGNNQKIAAIIFGHEDNYITRVIFEDREQTISKVRIINSPDAINKVIVDPAGNFFLAHRTAVVRTDLLPDVFILGSFDQPILGRPLAITTNQILTIAYNPDGKTFITSLCKTWNENDQCQKGGLELWDADSFEVIKQYEDVNSPIVKLAFSKTGHLLACRDTEGNIAIRDSKNFSLLMNLPGNSPPDGVNLLVPRYTIAYDSLATFSPDEKVLAETSNGRLKLWNIENPSPLEISQSEIQPANSGPITSISFSNNGSLLALSGYDYGLSIWDFSKNKKIANFPGNKDFPPPEVEFGPDDKYLVIGSSDGTLLFWDSEDYNMERAIRDEIEYTEIGRVLRVIEYDRPIKEFFSKLIFNFDGSLLYIESDVDDSDPGGMGNVRLLDVDKQRLIGFSIPIPQIGISISKDGKTMLSPGFVWDLDPQSWAQTACQTAGRNLTYEEWTQYFPNEEYQATCSQWPIDLITYQTLIEEVLSNSKEPYRAKVMLDKVETIMQKNGPTNEVDVRIIYRVMEEKIKEQIMTELTTGQLHQALDLLNQSRDLQPALNIDDPDFLNYLCWRGSMQGSAAEVLKYCELAAGFAPDDPYIRDSRGLARALTGDYVGAIEDFQFFIENSVNEKHAQQRRKWITDLSIGKNPFTYDVLNQLEPLFTWEPNFTLR